MILVTIDRFGFPVVSLNRSEIRQIKNESVYLVGLVDGKVSRKQRAPMKRDGFFDTV